PQPACGYWTRAGRRLPDRAALRGILFLLRQMRGQRHPRCSTWRSRGCRPGARVAEGAPWGGDPALSGAEVCEEPGRRGREQERPVGCGEDVGNVDIFEAAPEVPEVDGLAQNGAHGGNGFRPG